MRKTIRIREKKLTNCFLISKFSNPLGNLLNKKIISDGRESFSMESSPWRIHNRYYFLTATLKNIYFKIYILRGTKSDSSSSTLRFDDLNICIMHWDSRMWSSYQNISFHCEHYIQDNHVCIDSNIILIWLLYNERL